MNQSADAAGRLGERLAHALVDRLQPHVPDSVELAVHGTTIMMAATNGRGDSIDFMPVLDQDPDPRVHLENAIWMVLDHLQDFVVEFVLREPWPNVPELGEGAVLPTAVARRTDGGYVASYSGGRRVLELPLISDEELGLPRE